ncbi:MAG: transcription antitermination factor NusB [Pseudomonadales bacterium]|nr:transcription antitermination factor NusB [Pseudomonadales bacterium]
MTASNQDQRESGSEDKLKSAAAGQADKEQTGKERASKKLSRRHKARRMLLQAMYQWQIAQAPVYEIQSEFISYYQGKIDWDFFNEMFPAVVAAVPELDVQLSPLLDRKLSALDPIELSLLRIGLFELSRRIEVPYKVVINEAVELAKVFGATDSHKYVNGILDKAARSLRPHG